MVQRKQLFNPLLSQLAIRYFWLVMLVFGWFGLNEITKKLSSAAEDELCVPKGLINRWVD